MMGLIGCHGNCSVIGALDKIMYENIVSGTIKGTNSLIVDLMFLLCHNKNTLLK